MIDKISIRQKSIAQLKNIRLGELLQNFAEYLEKRGYSSSSRDEYFRIAQHFAFWISKESLAEQNINEEHVDKFLQSHAEQCSCPNPKGSYDRKHRHAALKQFISMLRALCIIPSLPHIPLTNFDRIIHDFEIYFAEVRGALPSTIKVYSRNIRDFLKIFCKDEHIDIRNLNADDIREYVVDRIKGYKPKTSKLITSSLRAFFRYLRMTNQINNPLEDAVPTVAYRRLSTIPNYITQDQMQHFILSFNISTAIGLRNKAMAVLMARLGLRACEVARLKIDDIDWNNAVITVRQNKSRRALYLPLTKEIGEHLSLYLKKNRPLTKERFVFVTHAFPKGNPLSSGAIKMAMRSSFKKCGLQIASYGTHILRHSFATQLMEKGANLKEIADMLGHASIETTNIYAKVNLQQLTHIALPWPEVEQ
ncbi:MAG: hypothetical protein A2Y62_04245 [Candidatus Fischerbacteria bacterium RBG_13_37_8]|uniref:Integrase n=1 Tax=Candidatus Fischerbacteria bacterium RBG_13_37_8 TaxID=1817863 RepID=A0A1F5V676_9BACT|nr:MAG: hypothetical protein A2Y62_04245 [Candidatus Fischerbacteria bacterium RBG_13_37_8]